MRALPASLLTRPWSVSIGCAALALASACGSNGDCPRGPLGPFGDWSEAKSFPVPGTGEEAYRGALVSRNQRSLYFVTDLGSTLDVWVAERASVTSPWSIPRNDLSPSVSPGGPPLDEPINTEATELLGSFGENDTFFYFSSSRSVASSCGGDDVLVAQRSDPSNNFMWQPAATLTCAPNGPNSASHDADPAYFGDPDTGRAWLYFVRNTRDSDRLSSNGYDIYVSVREPGAAFAEATLATKLSDPNSSERRPYVRSDGLEIVFGSTRPGAGNAKMNLWSASRQSINDEWSEPQSLGAVVNSDHADAAPALSCNGRELYFYSNRFNPQLPRLFWSSRSVNWTWYKPRTWTWVFGRRARLPLPIRDPRPPAR